MSCSELRGIIIPGSSGIIGILPREMCFLRKIYFGTHATRKKEQRLTTAHLIEPRRKKQIRRKPRPSSDPQPIPEISTLVSHVNDDDEK